jgi:hypothetical protein
MGLTIGEEKEKIKGWSEGNFFPQPASPRSELLQNPGSPASKLDPRSPHEPFCD